MIADGGKMGDREQRLGVVLFRIRWYGACAVAGDEAHGAEYAGDKAVLRACTLDYIYNTRKKQALSFDVNMFIAEEWLQLERDVLGQRPLISGPVDKVRAAYAETSTQLQALYPPLDAYRVRDR
jgi:hypothetical protein